MRHAAFLLKQGAAVVGAVAAIYGVLWSTGLAFVTNNQAREMIETAMTEYKARQVAFLSKRLSEQDARISKIADDFHAVTDVVGRLDERTRVVLDDVAAIRRSK